MNASSELSATMMVMRGAGRRARRGGAFAILLTLGLLVSVLVVAAGAESSAEQDPSVEDGFIQGAIVNGAPVGDLQGPMSTVRLGIEDGSPLGDFLCSGVVIALRVVLTAGHCVWDHNSPDYTAAPGQILIAEPLGFDPSGVFGVDWAVSRGSEAIYHPLWDGVDATLGSIDLAVIIADRDLVTRPALLARPGYGDRRLVWMGDHEPDPVSVTATGWGATDPNVSSDGAVLRFANMEFETVTFKSGCANDLSAGIQEPHLLCGRSSASSICFGDSGGPLWSVQPRAHAVVEGIASFVTNPVCRAESFHISVSSNIDWIDAQIPGSRPVAVPGRVGGLRATPTGSGVRVSWSAPDTGGSGLAAIVVSEMVTGFQVTLPGSATETTVNWSPAVDGPYVFSVQAVNGVGPGLVASDYSSGVVAQQPGYWLGDANSGLYAFGGAVSRPVPFAGGNFGSWGQVSAAAEVTGRGLWQLDASGSVQAHGQVEWFGDLTGQMFDDRAASISATPSGNGYWIFTEAGRAHNYGDAQWLGDLNGLSLNEPVVASFATPSGKGYFMVAADGGVFAFGDALFAGSTGNLTLNQEVVGMIPDPASGGYWLVAADGGVFSFGGAQFRGSVPQVLGGGSLNEPVVGGVAYGNGYLMFASDGGVFTFANLAFEGSLGGQLLGAPIVGIAAYG
jgi:hypothetical protein